MPKNINLPGGPTASPKGLKAVVVSTDDVREERAEVMSDVPVVGGPGGKKLGNMAEELDLGVRSRAPSEDDSEAAGLSRVNWSAAGDGVNWPPVSDPPLGLSRSLPGDFSPLTARVG